MAKRATPKAKPSRRKKISDQTKELLLTECGYRCSVPTCRNILGLDMHHIVEVHAGGPDDPSNLIVLCAYHHDMYHRGYITPGSIYTYKAMLVAISRAFDLDAVDRLLFLNGCAKDFLVVSGDGLIHFGRLIAAGLATAEQKANNSWQLVTYAVNISDRGRLIIEAWKQGDRLRLKKIIGGPVPGEV